MTHRVTPIPIARQMSATHHLPRRIGCAPGSTEARPVNIALVSFLPRSR
jgi:hypothetical protein